MQIRTPQGFLKLRVFISFKVYSIPKRPDLSRRPQDGFLILTTGLGIDKSNVTPVQLEAGLTCAFPTQLDTHGTHRFGKRGKKNA